MPLDMYYPHLKAGERTVVLHQLAAGFKFSKKWTHPWRVAWEKKHGPKSTFWDMVAALSDEITSKGTAILLIGGKKDKGQGYAVDEDDGDRKIPAQSRGSPNGKASIFPSFFPAGNAASSDKTPVSATTPIGLLSTQVLNTLQVHFRAHVGRANNKAMLDAIESVGKSDSSRKDSVRFVPMPLIHQTSCHALVKRSCTFSASRVLSVTQRLLLKRDPFKESSAQCQSAIPSLPLLMSMRLFQIGMS